MTPAVRAFEAVLDENKGFFCPNESRSGRFVKLAENTVDDGARHTAGNDAALTDDSDSDYEPSSSDSDKSDEFSGPPSECSLLWHLVMPHLRPGLLKCLEGSWCQECRFWSTALEETWKPQADVW